MHIPDGYLSPSTCATLYAASTPFWYVALRRLRKRLNTRMVPLLSVFAAFTFVIMMFNLPLPGGTTGHAVGVGIAVVVLGPWASMLAISIALVIQAILFGDGGITTLGANCFNMAIVGSLLAYLVYRVAGGHAPLRSSRRVWAAALAGYIGINAAALCAAVEFGIQPLFFKDASGAPLYAPYPLTIAIPAIMIGHLTFAGLAELFVSGGVLAYLQRTNASLLKLTAPGAIEFESGDWPSLGWRAARPLWTALTLLLLLAPLGILATGSAWGEWAARDFSNPVARQEIAQASRAVAPPAHAPAGLERLSSLWTAPFPRYAPAWVHSAAFGYLVSAVFGAGLILLLILIVAWLAARKRDAGNGVEEPCQVESAKR